MGQTFRALLIGTTSGAFLLLAVSLIGAPEGIVSKCEKIKRPAVSPTNPFGAVIDASGRNANYLPTDKASEVDRSRAESLSPFHEAKGENQKNTINPLSIDVTQNKTRQPYTPEQEQAYFELSNRIISDLASEAITIPDVLNSRELATLPMPLRMRLVGDILMKINNKELDIESVWPEG